MAAMFSAIAMGAFSTNRFSPFGDVNVLHNGVSRERHPWDKINLTKSERRGKTYEELQAIRKAIYEKEYEKDYGGN